jgi:hypothetical protein
MNLLAKIGLVALLAGTAGALYAEPAGGWLSPNGRSAAGGPSGSSATPAGTTPGTTAGTTATVQGPNGVTGSVGATVVLSLPDMQMRVHQLHDQVRADARHIQHLQQIARKEKDIIKLNCVNDKLVQVKPEMNIADSAEAELESARDTERMSVFDTIAQAAENVRRLREEADQCIGEPTATGGESSNSFTGPPASDDPTKGFGGGEIEPPGYASPYN